MGKGGGGTRGTGAHSYREWAGVFFQDTGSSTVQGVGGHKDEVLLLYRYVEL